MTRTFHAFLLIVFAAQALVIGQGPDAAKVLADVRAALGGDARLDGVKSVAVEGRLTRTTGGQTLSNDFEMAFELPDKFVKREVIAVMGQTSITRTTGFNGDGLIEVVDTPPQMGGGMVITRMAGAGPAGLQATPEQIAAQQAAADELRKWRTSAPLARVRDVRKLFNDAGVSIYAYKPDGMQKNMETTDAEFDYVFSIASALGASHLTMELPAGETAAPLMKRLAQFAEKHKVAVAYHTHGQGSMTAFDEAMALSKWNMINVDLGHYVAAGNVGGSPIQFLEKHHARVASFHLKDRTLPEHCSLTVPFGRGDGQIKDILLTMKKNKWTFPATVELESPVPADSDAVQEVKKCVEFARQALA